MKPEFYLRNTNSGALLVASGFLLGGLLQSVLLLERNQTVSILGMGLAGLVGGAFVSYRAGRVALLKTAFSYCLGFLSGGAISIWALWNLIKPGRGMDLPFLYSYVFLVMAFCLTGAVSAALAGRRLISVTASAICFLVGGGVGGAAIGVLIDSPVPSPYVAAIGLLIADTVGGALSGLALDRSSTSVED